MSEESRVTQLLHEWELKFLYLEPSAAIILFALCVRRSASLPRAEGVPVPAVASHGVIRLTIKSTWDLQRVQFQQRRSRPNSWEPAKHSPRIA